MFGLALKLRVPFMEPQLWAESARVCENPGFRCAVPDPITFYARIRRREWDGGAWLTSTSLTRHPRDHPALVVELSE